MAVSAFELQVLDFLTSIELLIDTALISYTISPAPDNIGGIKVNGSWTGVIGQIYANVKLSQLTA